ncbi:GGDEF domain-containing protein [Vulcaniibacterium gelatinicum]|uniref:GGDEF domain-containing protein n=1 Tax=Vulcaniibacterium gelatinicum TaxID=2598725 RepID=UPI0011CB3E5F|nr:sensor domain-containing diguanylate cyclase [Vulcaniibacterium gelatinicum]
MSEPPGSAATSTDGAAPCSVADAGPDHARPTALPDPRLQAARRAALLFAVAGALAIVQSLFLPSADVGPEYILLGLLDLAVAAAIAALPWQRWPAGALAAVIPVALAMVASFELFAPGMPPELALLFYLVVALWIGLSLPRWTVLKAAPLFLAADLAPEAWHGTLADGVSAAVTHVVIVVTTGEVVARVIADLRRAQAESERRARILRTLVLAAHGFNTLRSGEVVAQVVQSVRELGFDAAALSFVEPERNAYRVAFVSGFPEAFASGVHPLDQGITGMVWREPRTTVIERYREHPAAVPSLRESGFDYFVATPVREDGRTRAVLVAARRTPMALTDEVRDAFELLASHAAIALRNARSFEAEEARARTFLERALHDELTGLGNRRHADALLTALGDGDGLLLLDLDHFKQVNDADGHAAGDALLRELGEFLRQSLRDGDAAARYGGEEFLVVVPCGGPAAAQVAERLLAAWRARRPRTTMSIGWAVHRGGEPWQRTFDRADAALYRSKREGRDRVSGESAMDPA